VKGGVRNGKEFDTRHVSELVSVLISPLDSADDSLLSSIRRVRKK
jgi:hypothetical protein